MQITNTTVDDPRIVATGLFTAARRFQPLIVLLSATTLLLGLLWGATRPANDVATARVVLLDPNGAEVFVANEVPGDDERFVRTQARFLRSDNVLERAAVALDISIDDLRDAVSSSTGGDDDLLIISVRGDSPQEASHLLSEVIGSYRTARHEVVQEEVRRSRDEVDLLGVSASGAVTLILEERAVVFAANAAAYGDGVDFVQEIELTSNSTLRALLLNGAIGGLAGLALALFIAWQLADRDPLVETATDVRRIFNLPYLGRVPELSAAAIEVGAHRSFESIILGIETRMNRLAESGEEEAAPITRTLVVVGDRSGIGVTTTVRGLATGGAKSGLMVKVVEESGQIDHGRSVNEIDTPQGEVSRPDRCNFVLFDCPPLSIDTKALRMAPVVDAAVLLIPHRTRLAEVEETVDLLGRVDLPILGYIHSFEPKSRKA